MYSALQDTMTDQYFDLDSGALCLDFANTAEWHASQQPAERLNDIADLIAWGEQAAILAKNAAHEARHWAASEPAAAAAAHSQAIRLREAIYRIFSAYAAGQSVAQDDLTILNETLQLGQAQLELRQAADGFVWDWPGQGAGLALVGWAVARSAAELLTSDCLARVRPCADDRGCGYLFIDTSRNGRRRWCSMDACGNRAKARRHYNRTK